MTRPEAPNVVSNPLLEVFDAAVDLDAIEALVSELPGDFFGTVPAKRRRAFRKEFADGIWQAGRQYHYLKGVSKSLSTTSVPLPALKKIETASKALWMRVMIFSAAASRSPS